MDVAKAFEVAFNRKIEKNWEKIYVVVDIHDTILRACYENEEAYNYYPYSREALQLMTARDDICLILWSGCYAEKMDEYRAHFAEEGIRFDYANENPEVGNTSFQNFDSKLYFNVGIDDKFVFGYSLTNPLFLHFPDRQRRMRMMPRIFSSRAKPIHMPTRP